MSEIIVCHGIDILHTIVHQNKITKENEDPTTFVSSSPPPIPPPFSILGIVFKLDAIKLLNCFSQNKWKYA